MPYIKSTYEYAKTRKTFGRQILFQDVPGRLLDSINLSKIDQKQYILRNPVNFGIQATLPQSENEANTKQLVTHEQGINHIEGGWPREVHPTNEEQMARYCRRYIHEDNYVQSVLHTAPVMEHYMNQNNAIDMYETYFRGLPPQNPKEQCHIHIGYVFRDQYLRPVSCVKWTNEKNSMLAVAYSYRSYTSESDSVKRVLNDCYVWDVTRQMEPCHTFIPESPCWTLACSPVDAELIAGGLENGTVNLFDIRASVKSVQSSSVFYSHRGPITSLLYTHSRTNTECFTGSTDGQCLWWDTRNLSHPIENLLMSINIPSGKSPDLSNAEGVSCLEFDNGFPTKFLCGTESGLILNVNRMGKEHTEKIPSYWNAHIGFVRTVQRSPCTMRMFLSCGDNNVSIWSEEIRTAPIIEPKQYRYPIMDAEWAPLRYSSYMCICGGGNFYYWDLLRKYNKPVVKLEIAKCELTKMSIHRKGNTVAIGDSAGALHLLHLSNTMVEPSKNDKVLMFQTYERETRREHILDNRIKEIRLKIKAEHETITTHEDSINKEDVGEECVQEIEREYFKIVDEELNMQRNVTTSTDSLK